MNRDTLRQILVVTSLIVTLVFNGLSNSGLFNGETNATVANTFETQGALLYFPANSAFSIWGIIYSFLLAFVIYQAQPSQKENATQRSIGYLFVLTGLFNSAWVVVFTYKQFALSMVFMVGLLLTLLRIYTTLGIGVKPVTRKEKWLIHTPFSIYIGWITAATVANAAYFLTDAQWNGFGLEKETWAVIMLVITGVIGVGMTYFRKDIAYGLVVVWAVGWIIPRYSGSEYTATVTTATLVAVTVALVVAYNVFNQLRGKGNTASQPTLQTA